MIVINEQDLPNQIHRIIELFSTPELEKAENGKYARVYWKIEEIIKQTPGLDPCPFCGNAPTVEVEEGLGFKIRCVNKQCEINCESNRGEFLQELISQWNKRGGDK